MQFAENWDGIGTTDPLLATLRNDETPGISRGFVL
jgi:hypothetical protein